MRLARRVERIAPFYVMEFSGRAAALEAQGKHVVKLSVGEPDFGAPPAVLAALADVVQGEALPYTNALGLNALRHSKFGERPNAAFPPVCYRRPAPALRLAQLGATPSAMQSQGQRG